MHSQDGRYSVIFNGEIYNYRELRRELQDLGVAFVSDSDTEVLLGAWASWGQACLRKFVGMFAFVICDHARGTLTCARDAFGIKPLFYAHAREQFLFASELPVLLALRDERPSLNLQRSYDYLIHGIQDSGGDTFVENVHHLRPAHAMTFDMASCAIVENKVWWRPSIQQTTTLTFENAAETLQELFLDSVRMHLRSDVPVGAALSGGIDSSALVCAMHHIQPERPIDTFSFIGDQSEISEEPWVDLVNDHVGATAHKVRIQSEELVRDLPDLIRSQGEPFCTTTLYAQYRIFGEARSQGIPVVLEGQGADELLAGYEGYPGQRMRSLFERREFRQLRGFARAWSKWPGRNGKSPWKSLVGQMLPEGLHLKALKYTQEGIAPAWLDEAALRERGVSIRSPWMGRTEQGRGRRVVEALAYSLSEHELPSLLRFGDRNAMRFSVENRVPFLTVQMADFLLSLPEEYLISNSGETKSIFRAAMRGIVPEAVLRRKDKIGFVTPMRDWLRSMAPYVKDNIMAAAHCSFLNRNRMLAEFEEFLCGPRELTPQMWRMVNFVIWARLFNVGESAVDSA